jgi:hypothetical protein
MKREKPEDEVTLIGREFHQMKPSWTNRKLNISFAAFHSYIVSDLSDEEATWKASDVVGKGRCFCLDYEAILASEKKEDRQEMPSVDVLMEPSLDDFVEPSLEESQASEEKPPSWRDPGVSRWWLFNILGQCLDIH